MSGLLASLGLTLALVTSSASPQPADTTSPRPLTRADLEAWLDGLLPSALERGDIAGAVVAVVRDSAVLLQKGYGFADVATKLPVDPETTLFRPGSISKIFTWIAVMQQVERGALELDRDIAGYLDFELRDDYAEPITLRHLLTHTGGYEETLKSFYTLDSTRVQPLRTYLVTAQPKRIYPPGKIAAYSNYGTALAGYIVERSAGRPFDDYVEAEVLRPLGMHRSTFRQPLPAELRADMSAGYVRGTGDPWPIEIFGPGPAGNLTAPGGDLARFMLTMLDSTRQRPLRAETIELMYRRTEDPFPMMNGMGLGFYRKDRNGHRITAHGGDTRPFHSGFFLLPDAGAGIYISFNSIGANDAVMSLRTSLLEGFVDRYFPPAAPPGPLTALPTSAEHAALAVGRYEASRRWESSFLRVLNLDQTTVTARGDTLFVSSSTGLDGKVKAWLETEPFVWDEIGGQHRLAMLMEDGQVLGIKQSDDAATMLLPAPTWRGADWTVPLLLVTALSLLLAVVLWPIEALIRRRYRVPDPLTGRRRTLARLVRVVAVAGVGLIVGWFLVLWQLISFNAGAFNPDFDNTLRFLKLLGALVVIGVVPAVMNAWFAWKDRRSGWSRLGSTVLAGATVALAWFAVAYRFVNWSLRY